MGWQPGNDGRRPPPVLLGVLWIAVVALALAGCSKGKAEGTAASPAGLPVYKASVQKVQYSGMATASTGGRDPPRVRAAGVAVGQEHRRHRGRRQEEGRRRRGGLPELRRGRRGQHR